MRLAVLEGIVYALMVGLGEQNFVLDVTRLGGSALEQGLVVSLPLCLGAAGPLLALGALARIGRRKPVVVASTLLQAAILVLLSLGEFLRAVTPAALILAATIYQFGGQAAGTAWSSWYGDLVPFELRGRYFARRNRWIHVATCAAILLGGEALHLLEPIDTPGAAAGRGGAGFALVFGAAALFRTASALLLLLSPEPAFHGIPRPRRLIRFLGTERGGNASRVLAVGAAMQLMVYLASPYFGPHMLRNLGFSYREFQISTLSVVAMKFLWLPAWGRAVDRHGPRQTWSLIAVLVALVPLPWLWTRGLGCACVAQFFSGMSWAGYEVSYFALMLDASYKKPRPLLFGAQSLFNGAAQLLGTLGGARLLTLFGGSYLAIFAASSVGRLAVALCVPRLVRETRGASHVGRSALLLRVIGIRPHGGAAHRPIEEPGG